MLIGFSLQLVCFCCFRGTQNSELLFYYCAAVYQSPFHGEKVEQGGGKTGPKSEEGVSPTNMAEFGLAELGFTSMNATGACCHDAAMIGGPRVGPALLEGRSWQSRMNMRQIKL